MPPPRPAILAPRGPLDGLRSVLSEGLGLAAWLAAMAAIFLPAYVVMTCLSWWCERGVGR